MRELKDIGKEARLLDEKSIKERMKIPKKSIIKILVAIIIYILIMFSFYIFL